MHEDAPDPADAQAPRPSVMAFLRRREVHHVLWIALIYRVSEGLVKAMEGSYLVDAGVPLVQIGYLSGGAATTAGLVGAASAALLLKRFGSGWTLGLLGVLRTLCFALFAAPCAGPDHRNPADLRRRRLPNPDPLYGDRRALQPVHGGGV